ncbi:MAG: von Willebrand factor type A domain-containing protein [Lewinellaceae bacterium]|nr:von Willebrand factor type A domain-containing protein [Lewinellaceae bacterium]
MKIFLLMLAGLCTSALLLVQNNTVLQGTITEESTGEALIGASVKILKGTDLIKGVVTDYNGHYRLQIDPGTYDIEVDYTGYTTKKTTGVKVLEGKINTFDCVLSGAVTLDVIEITSYKAPLIEQDRTNSGKALTSQEIRSYPAAKPKASNPTAKERRTKFTPPVVKKDEEVIEALQEPELQDIATQDESPENYAHIVENQFLQATSNPVSTFSIDVDGAAYANARRFLNMGQLPPRDAVRVEEFVNYFDYQYKQPADGKPFAVHTELAKCPWMPQHHLLSIGLQGREIETGQLPASNFVFLVDVSGSMSDPDKLPLVQSSLLMLTDYLRPQDRVALVVYAGAAGLVLPSTPGNQKEKIKAAIEALGAGGSTAGAAGIQLAYQTARTNFINSGNNRVVLCTDGDFNVGVSDDASLIQLIEKERESGIFLTVMGFGMGNYQDAKMQQLANKGNGNHAYIDQLAEAKKVLINEFGGTLFTIAKDVKIQIEFNPAKVAAYRLIGYENRMLAREDFDDDTKDAGELGAGHRVTALYEIIPAGQDIPVASRNGDLKYQKTKLSAASKGNDLLTLKLRYKQPKAGASSELIQTVVLDKPATDLSENLTLAAAAASFGMVLRNSTYKGNATYQSALLLAKQAAKNDPSGYRTELCRLIEKAGAIR